MKNFYEKAYICSVPQRYILLFFRQEDGGGELCTWREEQKHRTEKKKCDVVNNTTRLQFAQNTGYTYGSNEIKFLWKDWKVKLKMWVSLGKPKRPSWILSSE